MPESQDSKKRIRALADAIFGQLDTDQRGARFVSQVENAVLSDTRATREEFERELTRLESAGTLLVRPQYCADPHLAGTDLRLAALVDDDDYETALASIEAAWQEWLKGYLASHRCT